MKIQIRINETEYSAELTDTPLSESLFTQLPMELTMNRSADHEYYAPIDSRLNLQDAEKTGFVKAGGIYYFAPWKAVSLNFRDMDIRPYEVYVLGQAEPALVSVLETGGKVAHAELRKEEQK